MKRVLNRKLYDTDRAEQIAQYAPHPDRWDIQFLVETLYKTADEEYFLHCRVVAVSEYVTTIEGGRTVEEELIVLDEEAALDWCEEHAIDGGIVIDEFEELVET